MYLNILLTNFYLNVTLVSDENEMFEAYKLLLNQMKTQTGKVSYKDYHKILLMAVRYGNTSSLNECLSGRNMCFRKFNNITFLNRSCRTYRKGDIFTLAILFPLNREGWYFCS